MGERRALTIITTIIASAAIFFLALHKGVPKPFDTFATVLILITISQWKTWDDLRAFWPKIKPYTTYLALVFAFIALGTIVDFQANKNFEEGLLVNFVRILFNGAVFLFFAFLISSRNKLLPWISIALLASFASALAAYWNFDEGVFIDGGRLKGFTQNPLIFGLLSAAGFLIALGLFSEAKKWWQKAIIVGGMVCVANFNLWAASRATWLGLVASLVLWFMLSHKKTLNKLKYIVFLPAAVFFLGWVFLPHSEQLAIRPWVKERAAHLATAPLEAGQTKILTWSELPAVILKNPLGFGFQRPQSYNTFFEVALFGGLGAFVFFLLLLVRFFKDAYCAIRNLDPLGNHLGGLKLGWMAASVAITIAIFFTDAFLWRQTWALLGISLGVVWSIFEKPQVDDLDNF